MLAFPNIVPSSIPIAEVIPSIPEFIVDASNRVFLRWERMITSTKEDQRKRFLIDKKAIIALRCKES
jgi:hypothetical protein